MKSKLLLLIIATAFLVSCAKVVVVPVSQVAPGDDKVTADGVFYALPKTVVRLGVKIDHTVAKAAPFMKFAAIFAPDGQAVCKDPQCEGEGEKEKYELQQGASFTTFGEPDPDHVFMVKFVGGGAFDQAVSMTWNDIGLLSAASASVTNRSTDVAIAGLKLAANLGTKAFFGATIKQVVEGKEVEFCPDPNPKNDPWIIQILKQNPETVTLVSNYCDIDAKDRDRFDRSQDKDPLTLATKAYVDHVAILASARQQLLTGGSQSMEPAELVSRLETLIAQRLAKLYLGSTKKETWEGSLDIRQLCAEKVIPVLRIDPVAGFCIDQAELAPDAKSIPEKFNILEGKDCQQAAAVNMVIDYYPSVKNQLFRKVSDNTVEPSGERSFRYRIPAQVRAELKDAKKSYGVGVFSVAQLGTIASLPAKHNSKMLSYDLTFLEATGGLKSFKLGTTGALDSATIDALSGIGGTILDARATARKADQTAKDDVTTLTRQDTLLKLKDEICQIQKKYGLVCTVQPQ